jgi:hypothetical protein
LPWPIVWLGFIVGGFHLVSLPVQLAISPIADGMTGPISVVLALVWILAAAVVLLIKPVWGTQPQPAVSAAVSLPTVSPDNIPAVWRDGPSCWSGSGGRLAGDASTAAQSSFEAAMALSSVANQHPLGIGAVGQSLGASGGQDLVD